MARAQRNARQSPFDSSGCTILPGEQQPWLVSWSSVRFVTAKPDPNDVDVFIVMEDHFIPSQLNEESLELFDHLQAGVQFGASVFWTKRSGIIGDEQAAIEDWQIKRDHNYRGIIEVVEEGP